MDTTTIIDANIAILRAMQDRFGDRVVWYGMFEPIDPITGEALQQITGPAILIRSEAEAYFGTEDPAGRLAVDCTWVARVVLTVLTEQLQVALTKISSEIATLILPRDGARLPRRGNRWGLGAAADWPTDVVRQPEQFQPGLNGFDERVIRWQQRIYIDG